MPNKDTAKDENKHPHPAPPPSEGEGEGGEWFYLRVKLGYLNYLIVKMSLSRRIDEMSEKVAMDPKGQKQGKLAEEGQGCFFYSLVVILVIPF